MNEAAIEGVIFDMDGTVLDTERMSHDSWYRYGKEHGLNITPELISSLVGRNARDGAIILQKALGPDISVEKFRRDASVYSREIIEREGIAVKKGFQELQAFLAQKGIPYIIATSTSREPAIDKMQKAGVTGLFPLAVFGDEIKNGKPDPEIILKAAAKIKVEPSRCIGIEDSGPGLVALSRAGVRSIYIHDVVTPKPDELALVWKTLADLSQVINLFAFL